jgi:hypothetical protein
MTATEVIGLLIDAIRKIALVRIGSLFSILKPDRFEIGHLALPGDQNDGPRDRALVYFCLESRGQTRQSLRGETNFFGLGSLRQTLRERGE